MMVMLGETNFLQISQLRRGLETENARLAAERIPPRQAARLRELARLMREEADPQRASRYDQEFHSLLCEASGNRLIRSLFSAMLSTFNDFISTMYGRIVEDPRQAEALHAAHQQLADALAAHDEAAAIQAVTTHFQVVDASIRRERPL